jgi:predicted RNA-binding Zn-ribbon protein involved in translation (DUF1610 family)
MGQILGCHCKFCSYNKPVSVGGTRSTFEKDNQFPAYCKDCEISFMLNKAINIFKCTECESSNILEYGEQTRNIESVYETRKLKYRDQVHDTEEYKPTWDEGYHICPSCKKNGLAFGPILRFFD